VLHGFEEAILLQGQFGQPVVAALELVQILRQPRRVDPGHFADMVAMFTVSNSQLLRPLRRSEQAPKGRRRALPYARWSP